MCLLLVHSFSLAIGIARASGTADGLHVQQTYGEVTTSAAPHTRPTHYDDTILAPPLPTPPPASFVVQLPTGSVQGLSTPQQGPFFGLDISRRQPFTPPITSPPTSDQWSVGPVNLFVAEALGLSNQAQVLDLEMNGGNDFTPGYAIYENGRPVRIALINFVDGASDYTAHISIDGTILSQVGVKYLSASSGTQKDGITWAGQTFADSDGGNVDVQIIQCDQTNRMCDVEVPALGAALVFLPDQGLATIDWTTAAVDPVVLATFKGIADAPTDGAGVNGTSLALSSLGALIAVCAFVCIESMLSYAITGNTPFRLLSDMTKNKNVR